MRDLALVIPVYNEECCIADVVGSWQAALDALRIDYEIIVINDGSTDGTATELEPSRAMIASMLSPSRTAGTDRPS